MKRELMMSELGNYLKFSNGKLSPEKKENGKYPIYGSNGIIGFSDNYNSDENTIIIGRVGAYCGSIHYSNSKCWVTDNAIIAVSKNILESKFWFHYLKSLNLNLMSHGSGQPLLNQTILKTISISIPESSIRISIGNRLDLFEQKITLNTQLNQTLEQIAQATFKSWFIDFEPVHAKATALAEGQTPEQVIIAAMTALSGKTTEQLHRLQAENPTAYNQLHTLAQAFPSEFEEVEGFGVVPKGWEVKVVRKLAKFVKGKKPKETFNKQDCGMLPHILVATLSGKYTEFVNHEKLVTSELQDTLILMDGSASGRVEIGHKGAVGSTIAKMELTNHNLWAFFYHFMKIKEKDIQDNTTGTGIPHTEKSRVLNYQLVIPIDNLLNKFNELYKNTLNLIISNRNEISHLEKTRDLLLPRLLNRDICK